MSLQLRKNCLKGAVIFFLLNLLGLNVEGSSYLETIDKDKFRCGEVFFNSHNLLEGIAGVFE